MKMKLFLLFLLTPICALYAQSAKKRLNEGVALYKQKQYEPALKKFEQANKDAKYGEIANFNRGDALYQQEKYADAAQAFVGVAEITKDKNLKAKALHNLGNAMLKEKNLENALKAYQLALMNNPKDEDTRYNLAYTKQLLQKEEEKKKDKKQDQQQQQQQQQGNKEEQKKEENKEQQQQKQQQSLNKQNAENMLDALDQNEKGVQKKVKDKKSKGPKTPSDKDW